MSTITIGRPGPRGHDRLQLAAAQDRMGRVGGRDHDVRGAQLLAEPVEAHAPAAEALGQLAGGADGAVRDDDLAHPVLHQRQGGGLGHPAGADHQHPAVGEVVEDVLGQVEGHRGDGRRARADVGARAHALADLEGLAEEAVEDGAGGALLGGEVPRAQHLPLDLALADDHRVEARGDAEELGGGAVVAQDVARAGELVGRDAGVGDDRLGHRVLRERPGPGRPRRSRCGCT